MNTLTNKRILLGITGGIAAYKGAEIVRRFQDAGAYQTLRTPGSSLRRSHDPDSCHRVGLEKSLR